jgi:hypothetical protein
MMVGEVLFIALIGAIVAKVVFDVNVVTLVTDWVKKLTKKDDEG